MVSEQLVIHESADVALVLQTQVKGLKSTNQRALCYIGIFYR
jgi:hypothetical protein